MSQLTCAPFEILLGDGGYIRGDVRAADVPGRRPVILIAHGFKGFKDWAFLPYVAEQFALAGFYTVTFNFSRNGVSGQEFDELSKFSLNTYSQEQADLASIVGDLIVSKLPLAERMERTRLGIVGYSRGGANAIIFAAEHPLVRAAAVWNSIARANLFDGDFEAKAREEGVAYTLDSRTGLELPIQREFFEDLDAGKERFDIPARLQRLRIPTLLIQSGEDTPERLEGFRQLREAAPHQPSLLIEGADHVFGTVHPFTEATAALDEALRSTISFFKDKL